MKRKRIIILGILLLTIFALCSYTGIVLADMGNGGHTYYNSNKVTIKDIGDCTEHIYFNPDPVVDEIDHTYTNPIQKGDGAGHTYDNP